MISRLHFQISEGDNVSEPWGQQPQQPGGDWSVPQGGGESGSFAPPPIDPQYGAPQQQQFGAQPQYGAPQQQAPQFGDQTQFAAQQPYGAPPYGAPGGFGGYVPPERQKNGLAVTGFILCFTGLLGLIFSILGHNEVKRSNGTVGGGGLALAGIIISILQLVGGLLWFTVVGAAINSAQHPHF